MQNQKKIKIALISLHGLIRGNAIELGRDSDTGGQVKYVVELARALAKQENIYQVDLITRQIFDSKVSTDYAQVEEVIGEGVRIIRIPFGPRRYLYKEKLWPHMESFIDQFLHFYRTSADLPDVIHGHYADAGYAGAQLARLLGIPFIFTGHSLGRVKKERLIESGLSDEKIEERYSINARIEAEEHALDTAATVIASTVQEVEDQYSKYHHYQPDMMEVIPPGVDLTHFNPGKVDVQDGGVLENICGFLKNPEKPAILAIARPDYRKNFHTLIEAYGQNKELQELANLVVIAGNRDNINDFDPQQKRVFQDIFTLIDIYDLYGKVAYPKAHKSDDISRIYQWASQTRGVFINPAFTEPFGLTLLEAAASGLPMIATNDGGPRDILAACNNGALIDPVDHAGIANALLKTLSEPETWDEYVQNGLKGVRKTYSWDTHAHKYVRIVEDVLSGHRAHRFDPQLVDKHITQIDRMIITDIDNTLTGDDDALREFVEMLNHMDSHVGFGIATGRNFDSACQLLDDMEIPRPDLMICSVGTEIYHTKNLILDSSWQRTINYRWERDKIVELLADVEGYYLQDDENQSDYKLSYDVDTKTGVKPAHLKQLLRKNNLSAKTVWSFGSFVDIIPIRAGDGLAVRHLAYKWGLPSERLLIAGDSGNDEEMLKGNTLGVVVANHSKELNRLKKYSRVYFSQASHARGIIEGIHYYNFLDTIEIPNEKHV